MNFKVCGSYLTVQILENPNFIIFLAQVIIIFQKFDKTLIYAEIVQVLQYWKSDSIWPKGTHRRAIFKYQLVSYHGNEFWQHCFTNKCFLNCGEFCWCGHKKQLSCDSCRGFCFLVEKMAPSCHISRNFFWICLV